MPPQVIKGLRPQEYEHPFDRRALSALESTPGLELLIRKLNEYGIERILRAINTGSAVRITPTAYADIFHVLLQACETIELGYIPELYVTQGYGINAYTAGVERPIVVLHSHTVERLSRDELLFVIGHECGHIKSQHVLYHQMATIIPIIGEVLGSMTLGVGNIASAALKYALLHWQRMSELTADRAGLLACQHFDAACSTMAKMAGVPRTHYHQMDSAEFLRQAAEFQQFDYDNLSKVAKFVSVIGQNHPWTVVRAAELMKWIQAGEYEAIIRRPNHFSLTCTNCQAPFVRDAAFCTRCGTPAPVAEVIS